MYSIAASYFEPEKIIAFDVDEDALEIARGNIDHYELEDQVELITTDILKLFETNNSSPIIDSSK